MKSFWRQIDEPTIAREALPELSQGDWLPDCLIPIFGPDFGGDGKPADVPVAKDDLIIVTQTCDLANEKVSLVALCPIHTLDRFEEMNPEFGAKGRWEEARKGRVEGLHLLASPTDPNNNRKALAVDFGQIISLPFEYLAERARRLDKRWRLESPFLEHFSQAFARFFMRVGLPSSIPRFR